MTPTVEQSDLRERDIYDVANQLAGYIGPDTAPELTAFLWRESKEAAKLARQVDAMRSRIERLEEALRVIAETTSKRQLPITTQVNDIARAALGDDG